MPHDFRGWTALVTGASSGLGEEFARQLAPLLNADKSGRGRLLLAARRVDRLRTLAADLAAAHPGLRVEALRADLSDPSEVAALGSRLEGEQIDLLVNNAGLGDQGLFEQSPERRCEEIVRVNVEALTLLTRRLLPGMVARGHGAVLNVGSVAGFLPLPSTALYAASKAFVNSLSEGLHWEVRDAGVTVTALCPGPVPTEFFQAAHRPGPDQGRVIPPPAFLQISAAQTVREALRAVQAGKPRIVTGSVMRAFGLLMRTLPLPLLRLAYGLLTPAYAQGLRKK